MENQIALENYLYGDELEITYDLSDIDYLADRIIKLPSLRPFDILKSERLCDVFCKNNDFRQKILNMINECPVLIYRLFMRGVFTFSEIEPFLHGRNSYILCFYFRKEISNFDTFIKTKIKPYFFDDSFFENETEIDFMIEHGFVDNSIEYCLKYDDIDVFRIFNISDDNMAKWSPFEWSRKPESLELLSFSGFFGSIKCFKHIIMNNFYINNQVRFSILSSGVSNLIRLNNAEIISLNGNVAIPSVFCRLSLVAYLIENGADINAKGNIWGSSVTPLHLASEHCHLSIVNYLVNHGADIHSQDEMVNHWFL